jgi:hypothetical protein
MSRFLPLGWQKFLHCYIEAQATAQIGPLALLTHSEQDYVAGTDLYLNPNDPVLSRR